MQCEGLDPPWVRLRVGGETFETSVDTLMQDAHSLFPLILCGDIPSARDSSGAVLIDRDPRRFRILLNFMRTREMVLEGGVDAESMVQEAKYFMLPDAEAAATRLVGPEKGQELLKCVVDARQGVLLHLQGGEKKVLRTIDINLLRDTVVAVSALFSCSSLGGDSTLATIIVADGSLSVGGAVRHGTTSGPGPGRSLHLMQRLAAGAHTIEVVCHLAPGSEGGCVLGPLRIEVSQLADKVIEWEASSDFSRPGAWGKDEVEGWTGGLGGDAAAVCEAVQAIAGSCVR